MEPPKEIWMGCFGGKLVRGLLGFGYSCRKEKIWKNDVKYIRADIHEAEISKLQTQLAEPKDSEAPADAVNGAVAKVGGYRYRVEETTERVPCTGKCKCLQCAGEEYWNKLSKKTKELNQFEFFDDNPELLEPEVKPNDAG